MSAISHKRTFSGAPEVQNRLYGKPPLKQLMEYPSPRDFFHWPARPHQQRRGGKMNKAILTTGVRERQRSVSSGEATAVVTPLAPRTRTSRREPSLPAPTTGPRGRTYTGKPGLPPSRRKPRGKAGLLSALTSAGTARPASAIRTRAVARAPGGRGVPWPFCRSRERRPCAPGPSVSRPLPGGRWTRP